MQDRRCFPLLLLQLAWITHASWAQRSPYSLQAAVDELAAKYPLNAPPSQQRYYGSALGSAAEQDYWDDDTDYPANTNTNYNYNNKNKNRNRHRLNKALAKYLERENYDADHGGLTPGPFGGYEFDEDNSNFFLNALNEKKRSSYFRERDNKYDNAPSSVFRERETQTSNGPEHAELTEQFLREIEETQEHEREERYKDALRQLWEKYQQQENEIKGDLFEEKKRMRMPPYYMLMQKKRSYPVLPWLPYAAERKKRFPVAKRSTKRSTNEGLSLGKTDEKVAKELSELFGTSRITDEKKKRSTDAQSADKTAATQAPETTSTAMSDMRLELPAKKDVNNSSEESSEEHGHAHNHAHTHQHEHGGEHQHVHGVAHQGHVQHMEHMGHNHQKRSDQHNSHESREESEESEEREEHDEHEEHEEGEESEEHEEHEEEPELEEEERKKKREVAAAEPSKHATGEEVKVEQLVPGDLSNYRRKKSIQWSKYFGLDRKKKSLKRDDKASLDMKKRSASDNEDAAESNESKKRNIDPEKLDNMDKKLQSIEDFIIDETIKYTGAHEGIANPEEIRRLKDHVLSRLATAYSLEKMRRALDKLRQSVDNENHLLRNVIEPESRAEENELLESQKRLSVKKEKAPIYNEDAHLSAASEKTHELHSNAMSKNSQQQSNDDEDDKKRRKKKRNGYLRYPEVPNEFSDFDEELPPGRYEALNDAYLGNKNYIIGSNQCPLIEAMAERCRGVDMLSGDVNQELLPICGVHQICYLCGTSQVACDYQYLAEADALCGNNNDCQGAARSVLMILRGAPGPQLGPRECLKNSCLYSAMREIGL